MLKIRIMYWKEIPAQIQVQSQDETKSQMLDDKFQKGIDAIAMKDGSYGNDLYIDAWQWSEFKEVTGDINEVLMLTAQKYNNCFPKDFVSRLIKLEDLGKRITTPGARARPGVITRGHSGALGQATASHSKSQQLSKVRAPT